MKTAILPSFSVLLFMSAFSCAGMRTQSNGPQNGTTANTETPKTSVTTVNEPKDSLSCKLPVLDADRYSNGSSDPYTLIGARINGKNLEIEVEYGGGCGKAEFDLVWNGALMKSLPPKAGVALLFKDEDYCKALVRKTICFDIHGIYNGEFVLMLRGYEGELSYSPQ